MKIFRFSIIIYIAFICSITANAQISFYAGASNSPSYLLAKDVQSVSDLVQVETTLGQMSLDALIGGGNISILQHDVLQKYSLEDMMKGTNLTQNIRILMPMGNREIHLVTRRKSPKKISAFKHLKEEGIKVAVIKESRGTSTTADVLKQLTSARWITVFADNVNDAMKKLLKNDIDAFFYVGTPPVSSLQKLGKLPLPIQKDLLLLSVEDPALVGSYQKATIPKGTYKWANYDVNTYAVKNLLITNTEGETEEIRNDLEKVMRAIKNNRAKLATKTGAQKHVWKKMNFDYSDVNWDLHPLAKKIGTN